MPVNPKEAPPGHMAVQYDPKNGTDCRACAYMHRPQCYEVVCTSIGRKGRKDGMAVIFVSIGYPPDGDE